MIQQYGGIYRNTKVLVTGHTGFKGTWLTRWLVHLGADVIGLALDPATEPNHWGLLRTNVREYRCDIRDLRSTVEVITIEKPQIVFHLAAQPLVRASYVDPTGTWSTNLMGTINLLEACRQAECVRALVVATTDKVYQEQSRPNGYLEIDPLGGHDPYSASKAACEMAVDSYQKSFFASSCMPLTATARAGNVIGGGDWSEDRLIPDIARSITTKETLEIRSPEATRPWQHVLDCLSGYLLLGAHLFEGKSEFARHGTLVLI
ncbi:CDP-glucose 4,6-dehydratase [Anoxynatronum sibiricum]|uniref:CDP-glucose 4,6-dehydratase n=1 Tax=Anoxynatronum sibiricum TaxID=210623 RepID=A0ABU9VWL5_9CLOT